jgi:hypothetical protein
MSTLDALQRRSRFEGMLIGEARDAESLEWLTTPRGLLAICTDAARSGDVEQLLDPRVDELLDDLDDHLPAFGDTRPSERARALVGAAQLAAGAGDRAEAIDRLVELAAAYTPPGHPHWEPSAALRSGPALPAGTLVDAALAGAPPGAAPHAGLVVASDVVRHFEGAKDTEGAGGQPRRPSVSVAVLISRHRDGDVVNLTLRESDGPPAIALDALGAPFTRTDAAFEEALRASVAVAGADRLSLRWTVSSARTGRALDAIVGGSVGIGAAVAADRLVRPELAPVDPTWVFTGRVLPSGETASLLGGGGHDYQNKLVAAADRTVVIPASDEADVRKLVSDNGLPARVLPASSVGDIEDLIDRHLSGKASYERALAGMEPAARRTPRWVYGALLGFGAVVALVAWFVASNLRSDAQERKARREAWGADVVVTLSDGPLAVQKNEVSNFQYALCMRHDRRCTAVATQFASTAPQQAVDPVRGVTAAQARGFCEWLGADLLTLPQWEELVRDHDPQEYEGSFDFQLQPADSEARGSDELNQLASNVAEWTRTTCDGDGSCHTWDSGAPPTQLRVVGISYAQALDTPEAETAKDALTTKRSEAADAWVPSLLDVGLRCARTP